MTMSSLNVGSNAGRTAMPSAFTRWWHSGYNGYWYRVKRGKRKMWVQEHKLLPTDERISKWRYYESPPYPLS